MIRVEVRRLHSPDVYDLEAYVPSEPGGFGILVQVLAGPAGEEGEESFDVVVCTPQWLSGDIGSSEIRMGRHHLFVSNYDYKALYDFIKNFADRCEGATWRDAALQFGRLGRWEYEDYTG